MVFFGGDSRLIYGLICFCMCCFFAFQLWCSKQDMQVTIMISENNIDEDDYDDDGGCGGGGSAAAAAADDDDDDDDDDD